MTDHTELKTAIEYILNQGALEREFIEDADALDAAWAVYEALGPTDILALIADIEDARNGMKHSCAIRLKKRIELLETQRDQLIADNERLTKAVGLQVIRRFVGDDDQKNIDELVAAGIQVDKELIVQLKAENERLLGDIERLKQKLREEITRTQAGVRLDLNLEKVISCICAIAEAKLTLVQGRIRDEMSVREVKLTEVDTRIESEIGLLRTS